MNYDLNDNTKTVVVKEGSIGLGTIGFFVFIAFLIVKLTANPVWLTWFWVWFPLWIPWAIAGALIIVILIIALIVGIIAAITGNL